MYMEEFGVDAKQDIINDNNSSNNPLLEFLKKETILKKDMDNDYFYRIIELFKKYGATFNPIIFMMHWNKFFYKYLQINAKKMS